MTWHLVLVILFAGQPFEFASTTAFGSLEQCNAQAVRIAAMPIAAPFAITCLSEAKA